MKKNIIAVPVVTALLLVATAVTASAQGDTSRGYLQGQQQNTERRAKFEQLAELSNDVEREDFFRAAGIGGAYSAELHLDAEELVDAGVIDQETADDIAAYASGKHLQLHGRYAGMGDLTPAECREAYADFEREDGDPLERLLIAGIITETQADAIQAYLEQ